jgi:periplasmic divalent cation tolerance protein
MYHHEKGRKMILTYITCKNKKEAEKIANHLLKNKLIACANIFPVNSLYRWKGKLQKDKEFVLIAKNIKTKAKQVENAVKKIHSYDIPCIIQKEVTANKEYVRWIQDEIKK